MYNFNAQPINASNQMMPPKDCCTGLAELLVHVIKNWSIWSSNSPNTATARTGTVSSAKQSA